MKGGILVVDKPAGPTSFAVVERVRRALGAAKAGHTGTLDPAATGVLAVCLDDAVKLQHWITEGDKAYEALVAFGVATDTEDAEGREMERGDPTGLTAERVAAALCRLRRRDRPGPAHVLGGAGRGPAAPRGGPGRQGGRAGAPPGGRPLPRPPRPSSPPLDGLARARIAVRCGKGTYVRTWPPPWGRRSASRPTWPRSGAPRPARSPSPAALAARRAGAAAPPPTRARSTPAGLPGRRPGRPSPSLRVTRDEVRALAQGKILRREAPGALCRALDEAGGLVAMVAPAEDGEGLRPVRVFVQPPGIPGPDPREALTSPGPGR